MLASKDSHFAELKRLNEKRDSGEQRTLSEAAYLDKLLAEHDVCVRRFSSAMRELAAVDASARAALLSAITAVNRDLGNVGKPD